MFEEYELSFRHMYHPTDDQFENTNLQILTYRNLLVSAHISSWSET